MASHLHLLRLNARELLRQPGLDKTVSAEMPAADLGVDDQRITGSVSVALVAVSNIDGVVVTGTITMPWATSCRRCLAEVAGTTVIDLDELYQDPSEAVHGDAFAIEGDQIDLVPAVREAVLLELPDDVLCATSCAGICPLCGIDRNTGTCTCDTTVRDDRWAALDQLRLED